MLAALLLASALPAAARASAPPPVAEDVRQALEDVGYAFDDKGAAVGRDGKPLTQQALDAWLAPYDYRKEPLSEAEESDLVLDGCRLEESTSHIVCLPDKKPLSRLGVQRRRGGARPQQSNALERIGALLAKAAPGAPVGADVADEVRALEKAKPGSVPPALRDELLAPKGLTTARAAADVQAAYLDSTRFFDGRSPLSALAERSVPLPADWKPKFDVKFFDDGERRVSQLLQDAAVRRMEGNPVSAELLAHFRGADGKLSLPPIHVLPISSDLSGNYENGEIAVSRDDLLTSLSVGDDGRYEVLDRRLKTSAALAAYLKSHPKALDRYLALNEETLVHELTHAWQNRRDRIWPESDRGNVPGGDYAEDEHEAFLTEMRFLNEKLKRSPLAKVEPLELQRYQLLALDFDRWRDQITQDYFRSYPDATNDVETARAIQAERISAARALMGDSVYQAVYQGLKLAGLELGSKTLDGFSAGYSKRMDDFAKNGYPAFKRDASGVLARRKLAQALNLKPGKQRDIQLDEAAHLARQSGDAALQSEIEAARHPAPLHAS